MDSLAVEVNYFQAANDDGRTILQRRESSVVALANNVFGQSKTVKFGANWSATVSTSKVSTSESRLGVESNIRGTKITADFALATDAPSPIENCSVSLSLKLAPRAGRYILLPATLYNGNRCVSRRTPYSPRIAEDLATPDAPLVMNDVFRLGGGAEATQTRVQLLARDTTFPMVATNTNSSDAGLLAELPTSGPCADSGTDSIEVSEPGGPDSELVLRFSKPGVREDRTYWITNQKEKLSTDKGVTVAPGDTVRLEIIVHTFTDADSPAKVINAVYNRRSDIEAEQREMHPDRKLCFPLSEAAHVLEDSWNEVWNDKMSLYPTSERETDPYYWQSGWCGGLMKVQMLVRGSELSRERSLRELTNFFDNAPVASSGLFLPLAKKEPGAFSTEYAWETREWAQHFKTWTLVRRQADIAYYLTKQLALFAQASPEKAASCVPPAWWAHIDACCDAFVKCFRSCGQLGFFFEVSTGMVAVGNSTSGGLVPAVLVLAHRRHPDRGYLEAASDIADYLVKNFLDAGFTCGGPGDAMHAPDSESCALLNESLVMLYEETGSGRWLEKAEDCAKLLSTWVYPYFFPFPPESGLGRAGSESKGAVWANVQNRHGAPGICTHSGSFLLRLYRATGKQSYLDMLSDIAITISQMVSRPPDAPIYNFKGGVQRLGAVNERVNTSHWDGPNVGGVHCSTSAWCEATLGLMALELPSIYIDKDSQKATCFDHVHVGRVEGSEVTVTNPTSYDAWITMLAEGSEARATALSEGYFLDLERHRLKAGETLTFTY